MPFAYEIFEEANIDSLVVVQSENGTPVNCHD